MGGQGTGVDVIRLRTCPADLVVPAAVEMPVAFELWAGGTGGNLGVDIGPWSPTVPLHVLGGDLVRDALIAQSRHQPIEQRRGVVAPDGGGNAFGPQVGANVVDQAGRARQAADTVHHPNSVIDCRCLATIGIRPALPRRGNLRAGCRS